MMPTITLYPFDIILLVIAINFVGKVFPWKKNGEFANSTLYALFSSVIIFVLWIVITYKFGIHIKVG